MSKTDSQLMDVLHQHGLQVTPARLAALHYFETADKPLDAQFLIDNLHTDRVTVFRMLNTFVAKGLLRKLEFGEGKARYELNEEEHHHLICEVCGKIDNLPHYDIPQLHNDIQKTKGFLVKFHNVEYFGICKDCQRKGIVQI